jgi:arsenate reductase
MDKKKVLFVCVHNSARSQLAEAYLAHFAGDKFLAESAGFEPGTLNALVVKAMQEDGIDISKNKTDSLMDFYNEGRHYHYIITVCDEASGEKCPVFPGLLEKRIHWSFEDPSQFQGSEEEKLAKVRQVRDAIKAKIQQFINDKS